jgi:DNA sulfur modification protein DndE
MRIKISKENEDVLDKLKALFRFKHDGIIPRIAFGYSLQQSKFFNLDEDKIPPSDGKEFRDDKGLFGTIIEGESNYPIFKAVLNQHYNKTLYEDDFAKLFKLHLNHGLFLINEELSDCDLTKGGHIDFLMKIVKKGLDLKKSTVNLYHPSEQSFDMEEYKSPLSFDIGKINNDEIVKIKINDLNEFDNRNIAIAGMAGSGKTQLIKDILYQISRNTENKLKFIFFDYKGEGNIEQLKPFLNATNCEFVDILNDSFKFNPLSSIDLGKRQRTFSIKAFVDTIATFVPSIGVSQKNILQTVITELLDANSSLNKLSDLNIKTNPYPTIEELFEQLEDYYEKTGTKQDTLYAAIRDLSSGLFSNEVSENILNKSIYLNLPPTLSDTLRQLVVFLLLRYFNFFFSSMNDAEPVNNIMPLRYVIVVDEAHIYLKNKNARKALEELLRLLRSKGVIVVMLSQGVEDYKTKDFDFASQVKLPICLNVQNKDYKMITSFLGTPKSKFKLEQEISKLEGGKGIVNLTEPQLVVLNQFWKTAEKDNL